MGIPYDRPTFDGPHRVLLLAAATDPWWELDQARREELMPLLAELLSASDDRDVTLLGSFDDDYFMTGPPTTLPFSMYLLYELVDPGRVVDMIHELRSSGLARYFRVEARLGRQLFLVDK